MSYHRNILLWTFLVTLAGCITADKTPPMEKVSSVDSGYTPDQIHQICYAQAIVGGGSYTPPITPTPQNYRTMCAPDGIGGMNCRSVAMPYGAGFADGFAKSFNEGLARRDSKPQFSEPHYRACLAKYGYILSRKKKS